MNQQWSNQKERGSPFLIHTILWIALKMGRKPARLLLYPITFYFLLAAPAQRRASRDFLSRIKGSQATLIDSAKHIFYFASTLLDRVFLLSGRKQEFDINIHGLEIIQEKIDSQRGVLLLGSHLGSFEVMRAIAILESQVNLKVLMHVEHNAFITRLLDKLNPDIAHSVIPLGGLDSMIKVNESLENAEMVGILGDRVIESDKMLPCQFLGSKTNFPAGPILLASTCHAPIILIFGLYRGGNRYDIHFELFSEGISINRQHRETELQDWVQRYADRLEHYARKAPYNWFNFYDFWRQ
ncbi:LpxL/LpxP family acyltransferase [Kaarinaea lacus]